MSPSLQIADALLAGAAQTARRSADYLLKRQHADGYWWGHLTADTTLESDYILLQLWLHPPVDGVWHPPTFALVEQAAQSILRRQLLRFRASYGHAICSKTARTGKCVQSFVPY